MRPFVSTSNDEIKSCLEKMSAAEAVRIRFSSDFIKIGLFDSRLAATLFLKIKIHSFLSVFSALIIISYWTSSLLSPVMRRFKSVTEYQSDEPKLTNISSTRVV